MIEEVSQTKLICLILNCHFQYKKTAKNSNLTCLFEFGTYKMCGCALDIPNAQKLLLQNSFESLKYVVHLSKLNENFVYEDEKNLISF